MTRSRQSAKDAGAKFERSQADYLAIQMREERIDRRVKRGQNDAGDIGGVRTIRGGRVVLELKDYGGQVKVKPWLDEAEVERANDQAVIGAVVFKRKGIGNPGEQGVLMTVDTLIELLGGGPDLERAVGTDPMTLKVGQVEHDGGT